MKERPKKLVKGAKVIGGKVPKCAVGCSCTTKETPKDGRSFPEKTKDGAFRRGNGLDDSAEGTAVRKA